MTHHINIYLKDEDVEEYATEPDWGSELWRTLLLQALQDHYGKGDPLNRIRYLQGRIRQIDLKLSALDDSYDQEKRALQRTRANLEALVQRVQQKINEKERLTKALDVSGDVASLPSRQAKL